MDAVYVLSGVVGVGILVTFGCLVYNDLRYQKLPNSLIIVSIILSVIFIILTDIVIEQKNYSITLIEHTLALLPVSGFYLVTYFLSKGKLIGLGDVKLGVPIAVLLTWEGALMALVIANLMAFLVILPLVVTKKIKANTKIPFGPFLIVACVLTFFGMKFLVNFF